MEKYKKLAPSTAPLLIYVTVMNMQDEQEIANGFNDFFVNIGPALANNIVSPENNDVLQYMIDSNVNSMFLNGVNRKEILDVIKSFANKTSTDYNGLNMFILEKITNFIVKPFFTYM